jgi:hypothetical protein
MRERLNVAIRTIAIPSILQNANGGNPVASGLLHRFGFEGLKNFFCRHDFNLKKKIC